MGLSALVLIGLQNTMLFAYGNVTIKLGSSVNHHSVEFKLGIDNDPRQTGTSGPLAEGQSFTWWAPAIGADHVKLLIRPHDMTISPSAGHTIKSFDYNTSRDYNIVCNMTTLTEGNCEVH